jgi:DnaK suppressor protein
VAKHVRSSKAVAKRTASRKKKVKRSASARKAKKKTAKKTAAMATRKTSTAERASPSATSQSTPKRVRKAAEKATVKKAKAKRAKASKRNPSTQTPARTAPSVASQDPVQVPVEEKKPPRTYLTKKQLEEFRQLLLLKRAELAGDVDHLTSEAFNRKGQGEGEHSAMPIHMADLGSDNWEKEFTLGLIENEQALIREIDAALSRIADKTYGMCLATHQQISLARLRAKPWAKYCIEYARAREEGRAR